MYVCRVYCTPARLAFSLVSWLAGSCRSACRSRCARSGRSYLGTSDRSTYSVGNREGGKSASRRPGEFVPRTISHNVRSLRQPEAIENRAQPGAISLRDRCLVRDVPVAGQRNRAAHGERPGGSGPADCGISLRDVNSDQCVVRTDDLDTSY